MTDDISPNLGLPFYQTKQNEFEVQHNEALLMLDALVMLAVKDRDLSAPPGSPALGDRYLVKPAGSGDFSGMDNRIAQYDIGGWNFYAPQPGWTCYVQDEQMLLAWDGEFWEPALDVLGGGADIQNLNLLGIGTTADAGNPLSAKLNNALWTAKTVAEGGDGDLRYKLSKETAAKTLSFLFQNNFSGRAEIGLTGDDDFHFKVSADGSTWFDAITIDRTTGKLAFGQGFSDPTATRGKLSAAPYAAMAGNNKARNGGMDVSQELGTAGATLTNNTARYILDMAEAMYNHGAATAVVTSAQLAAASFPSALPGFAFGHQIKATTAITAPASGDFAKHRFKIEGYEVAAWGWGAAGALDLAYAFQFYSTASGVALLRVSNSAGDRFYYTELTVAAGWNFFAGTIPGDTSGTWLKTNGTGLVLEVFCSGKETTPGTSFNTWGATAKIQTTNSTNLLGTNNNCTILTGLYIAAGTQLPAASDLPRLKPTFSAALQLAQRYYEKTFDYATAPIQNVGSTGSPGLLGLVLSGTLSDLLWQFKARKRTAPTVTTYSPTQASANWRNGGDTSDATASVPVTGEASAILRAASGIDTTSYRIHAVADARL